MNFSISSFGRSVSAIARLVGAALLTMWASAVLAQTPPDVFDPINPSSTPITAASDVRFAGEQSAKQFGGIVQGITNDLANTAFEPTSNVRPTARCATTTKDGVDFRAVSPTFDVSGTTVGYDADECSVIASAQFDLSEANIFGAGTHFSVGLFGGYTSISIDFDPSLLAQSRGLLGNSSTNRSLLVGGYATIARDGYYAVGSGAYMSGSSDITDRLNGAFGEYDNTAYTFSATVGKSIPIQGTLNVDFRGGLQYVNHDGDAFVDSVGNAYGESNVSYWQGQLSVGLFGMVNAGDVVYRPYVRAAISSKFDFDSTASANDVNFQFDQGSTVIFSLSAGTTANLSEKVQLSGEVSGDFASDETTFAGKLGLKYQF